MCNFVLLIPLPRHLILDRVGNSLLGFCVWISLVTHLEKIDESDLFPLLQRAMKSDSLFCFGHNKRKKQGEKNELQYKFSLQRSFTLLKRLTRAIFSLALFVKSNTRANYSSCSLSKEQQERFAPFALSKRATRAKEQIPNPVPRTLEGATVLGQTPLILLYLCTSILDGDQLHCRESTYSLLSPHTVTWKKDECPA